MDDWRVRVILGAVAALVAGAVAWGLITGDEVVEPSTAEKRVFAASACQDWVADKVDPLDVDFRDPARAAVSQDGDTYTVQDRAAVSGDLVNYECTTTRRANGDWQLEGIELR